MSTTPFKAPPLSRRRLLGQAAGVVVISFGVRSPAHGAGILAVRVWPADEYTRVTIESDTVLSVTQTLHKNPDRLSIDIDGLELSDPLRELVSKVRPDDPYIAGVRIAQYKPRVVRMVLDLKQAAAPQVFTLKPVAAYQHRLVFDLYPTVAVDPLIALVRDKEAAERRAATAMADALSELIKSIEGGKGSGAATASSPSPALPGSGAPGDLPRVAGLPAPRASDAAPGPTTDQQKKYDRLVIVALDPGHGGEDPGAIGPTGLREKDVVLSIAVALRDKLNALPNMRVFLTRDADFFVPLQERVRKARRVQADLFVSIHADAFNLPHARGASVFALSDGAATSTAAQWLASKENAADAVGGINVSSRAKKDPHAMRALLDMSTAAQIKDSMSLGKEVLGQLDRVGRLHKQRVEQAGFAVLKAPDVPSILVETAFISNPDEEAKLRDTEYRARLVDALFNGIRRYFVKNPPMARQRSL